MISRVDATSPAAAGPVPRRGVLAGCAGLALATLAGCASGTAHAGTASRVEKPSLTVAAVPAVTNMGLFLAQSRGFFAAEGLRVTVQAIQSSTVAIAAQLHGAVDVTAGAYVSYVSAQAESAGAVSWRILAEGAVSRPGSQQILVPAGSPVASLAGLRGKTIGSNILDNIGTLLVQSALAAHGIPASSVRLVAIPFPDMASALASGEIDAGWFDEPFLSAARLGGKARALYDTCQGATADFPISGYLATAAWARRYPRTATAFTRAVRSGQRLAGAQRPADEKAAVQFIKGITAQAASAVTFDSYPAGAVDAARLQRVPDAMRRFGLLARPFSMAAMTAPVT